MRLSPIDKEALASAATDKDTLTVTAFDPQTWQRVSRDVPQIRPGQLEDRFNNLMTSSSLPAALVPPNERTPLNSKPLFS